MMLPKSSCTMAKARLLLSFLPRYYSWIVTSPATTLLSSKSQKLPSLAHPFSTRATTQMNSNKKHARNDELYYKTFSDAMDESDALEIGKQKQHLQWINRAKKTPSSTLHKMAEQFSNLHVATRRFLRTNLKHIFRSDRILKEPRGNAFAPFSLGGREQKQTKENEEMKSRPRHGDVLSKEQILQKTFSDAFDESDWVEAGKRQRSS